MTDQITMFRLALIQARNHPCAEHLAEVGRCAEPLSARTDRMRDVRRVGRAPIVTFHEFMQGVRRVFGTHWPLADPSQGEPWSADEVQDMWTQIVLAAMLSGPATVAFLADGWLDAIVPIFDAGPEQFAGRRRYGMVVPSQRLCHLLATPLILPENAAELLGDDGLAGMSESIAWEPGTVALPKTLAGMIAVMMATLPEDSSTDRVDALLADLLDANGISDHPRMAAFFVDMTGAGPDRALRFAEWLHLRLPAIDAAPAESIDHHEAAVDREQALCRLLSAAEQASLSA
ncbi:hypothetical protein KQI84_13065 [bacterium]|nr:hypothetical protein [bacterium]